jgi:hypothetical protein
MRPGSARCTRAAWPVAGRSSTTVSEFNPPCRHAAIHPHAEPPATAHAYMPMVLAMRRPCGNGRGWAGTERPESAAVPVVGGGQLRSVDGEARCAAPVGAWDDRELLVRRARGLGEEVGGHKRMPAAAKGALSNGNETSRTRGPESMSGVGAGGETTHAHTLLSHLRRDLAQPCHICTGTRPAPPTSATGLGPPPPTSAPGPPLPHLRRDWARPCPHLRRDWARPCPHLHQDCAHGSTWRPGRT